MVKWDFFYVGVLMKLLAKFVGLMVIVAGAVWLWWSNTPKAVPTAPPAPKQYHAPTYDVVSWTLSPKTRDFETLIAHLGVPTKGEAMDFYGNVAVQYRFFAPQEPPLYAVVGTNSLELVWYHAVANDNEGFKAHSLASAQKVYAVMSAIYQKDATPLMSAILSDKPAPTLSGVTHAKCRAYQCQIVLDTSTLGIKLPPKTKASS